MSKIGKKKILIPKEVNLSINGGSIDVKGPLGIKKINLNTKLFDVKISKNNELSIEPKRKNDDIKKMWGVNRSLLNNAVIGVNKGFVKTLEMTGVGYKAAIKDNSLNLQLGYSHGTDFEIPKDVKISVEKQTIINISGLDKQLVGTVASKIKSFRPSEPYKGKGIKEKGEYILRKEGKKK
ncbi:MAG: 50S ribosomal protein L6 [Candidatus Pelagibacter sp.]|jgi:large subunit ribosomal protein L6|nr:50S ribosomal protein L6 [Candidatus Pelagibacter sp.]|tara:strand:+ start:7381 stop:7920 length:540 start_codon:yes stop_codon:yes gene_type:complete